MNILVVIPARGGSKRLPYKNRRILAGMPLIAYSIGVAKRSKYKKHFDLICSTDDERIAKIAQTYKCDVPFMRPKKISTEKALSADVVLHALRFMEQKESKKYNYVILLQPTSPLRTRKQLDEAINIMLKHKCDSVISVVELNRESRNMRLLDRDKYLTCLKTSDGKVSGKNFKDLLAVNGAIYITRRDVIAKQKDFYGKRSLPYYMDEDTSIDIDTMSDFRRAESIIGKQKRKMV